VEKDGKFRIGYFQTRSASILASSTEKSSSERPRLRRMIFFNHLNDEMDSWLTFNKVKKDQAPQPMAPAITFRDTMGWANGHCNAASFPLGTPLRKLPVIVSARDISKSHRHPKSP
jgi:hypothetical protein